MSRFASYHKCDTDGKTVIKDNGTVRDLSETLGLPIKYVRIITVNGRQGNLETPLAEEDLVYIFPPAIGGG